MEGANGERSRKKINTLLEDRKEWEREGEEREKKTKESCPPVVDVTVTHYLLPSLSSGGLGGWHEASILGQTE